MFIYLFLFQGGVANAITNSAGPKLLDEYRSFLFMNSKLPFGYVHPTPAYNLRNQSHILHVNSPIRPKVQAPNNQLLNANQIVFYNIIRKAFCDLNLNSFATPLIGTGCNGISVDDCVDDLIEAIIKFKADFDSQSIPSFDSFYLHPQSNHLQFDNKIKRTIYLVSNLPTVLKLVQDIIDLKLSLLTPQIQPDTKTQAKSSSSSASSFSNISNDPNADCPICMDKLSSPKILDKCGHTFCTDCINEQFKVKKACPICNTIYGVTSGDQPDGTMTYRIISLILPGFDSSTKTIEITYNIPGGIQSSSHPSPGKPYHGTHRIAYLPDNSEGRNVLSLLKKAFDQKLIFTIGQSRTTGRDDCVTWNDIHHKTKVNGGSAK